MSTVVVRYRPKAEHVEENQRLVEAVFAELSAQSPGGLRYATFRLDDGTFVHIADIEGDENPLASSPAFAAFQSGIGDRCEEGAGPNPQQATLIGSYHLLAD